jgi:hypothetical protein
MLKTLRTKKLVSRLIAAIILLASISSAASDKNLELMTRARVQYGKNDLKSAIATYDQVSKESDFWAESQEEKAWAYVRQNKFDESLSSLKSLFTSIFLPQIGPETFVLAAFVDYKICDYKRAYQRILDFKRLMVPRVDSLEGIVAQPENELTKKWITRMASEGVSSADLGKDLPKMPRFFYRDEKIIKALKAGNTLPAYQRLKVLAKADLAEITTNLNKMKVIEVEVIQRSYSYDTKQTQGDLKFEKITQKDMLTFPDEKDSREIWVDEIGKYQIRTQKCPTTKGRS